MIAVSQATVLDVVQPTSELRAETWAQQISASVGPFSHSFITELIGGLRNYSGIVLTLTDLPSLLRTLACSYNKSQRDALFLRFIR